MFTAFFFLFFFFLRERECFAWLLVEVKTWILLDRIEQWVREPSADLGDFRNF